MKQPELEARSLALKLRLSADGSLDAFVYEADMNAEDHIIFYDTLNLGKQLKTMGSLVITNAMISRVNGSWRKDERAHIFLDEFHVVFENKESVSFFNSAWRRFRKHDAFPTDTMQDAECLLDNAQANAMTNNSGFAVILNQSCQNREKLAELLNTSEEQLPYITNVQFGCGLIKYGGSFVLFANKFLKDTKLCQFMATKPKDREDM